MEDKLQQVSVKLSVIAPTYNEVLNIDRLAQLVHVALQGIDYELLIADDNSPDMTWRRVEELSVTNPRLRLIRRLNERGLSSAVMAGFDAARGDLVACIDGDLQHDPAVLPQMLKQAGNGAEVVIASRYVAGGGVGKWRWSRRTGSWICTKLAQLCVHATIRDPLSGYFMLRRSDYLRVREQLNPSGFKILLELVGALRPSHVAEVPFVFGTRINGVSKLSSVVVFQFLRQLIGLAFMRQTAASPAGLGARTLVRPPRIGHP